MEEKVPAIQARAEKKQTNMREGALIDLPIYIHTLLDQLYTFNMMVNKAQRLFDHEDHG